MPKVLITNWFNNLRKIFKLDNNCKIENKIYREIEELKKEINNWHNILNQESIWLLSSSLGLWSFPLLPLASHRLVVAGLFLIAFLKRIEWRKGNRKKSFPKCISRIELQIASLNSNEKTKQLMYYKLDELKELATGVSRYKNTWIFTVFWCYYIFCCWFFANTVLVSIRDRLLNSLQ